MAHSSSESPDARERRASTVPSDAGRVRFVIANLDHIDAGAMTVSIGFSIELYAPVAPPGREETPALLECQRVHDATRRRFVGTIDALDVLENAIVWIEPWDGVVRRSPVDGRREVLVRIEVDRTIVGAVVDGDSRERVLSDRVERALTERGFDRTRTAAARDGLPQ